MTENQIAISIIATCPHQICQWIDIAWSQIVVSQVEHRKGLNNLPAINLQATARNLCKQEPPDRRIMTKYLAGAWTTGDKIAHWKPNDAGCILCQNPDSIHHRFHECPFTAPIREGHHSTMDFVHKFVPFWPYSPVTRMKPSGGSSVLLRLEFPCKVLPETLITAISAVSILTVLVGLGLCLKQVLPLGRLWWIRLKMMNKGLKQQPLGVKVNHGHLLSNLSTLEELWVGKVMTELNYMLLSDHCRFYYPKHPDLL